MKARMLLLLIWGAAVSIFCSVDVRQQDLSNFTIHFTLPDFSIQSNENYSNIVSPDLNRHPETGYPDLPYREYKIAVPYNGNVQISVTSVQTEKQTLKLPIEPVPVIKRTSKVDAYSYEMNAAAYQNVRAETWAVSPIESYRYWNYVKLRIYPFSYDHKKKELSVTRSIDLHVHINGDTEHREIIEDKLKDAFLSDILNGSSAENWGHRDKPAIQYTDFSVSDHWYSFEVPSDGLYSLTYDDLRTVLNIQDVIPDSIRIFTTGGQTMSQHQDDNGLQFKEIPLYIDAGNDGSFNQGDKIVFYGQDRDDYTQNSNIIQDAITTTFYAPIYFNPYSQNVKYWLTYTGDYHTQPARITTLPGFETYSNSWTTNAETLKLESDVMKREPNPMGFHMFQSLLAGSTTASYNYSFSLDNADLTVPQKVEVAMQQQQLTGTSGQVHTISLALNQNTVISSATFSSDNYGDISRTGNYCQNGTNQLVLTVYRTTSENLYLDFFKIQYERKLIKAASQQYRVNVHTADYNQNVRYEFTSASTDPVRVYKISSFNQVSIVPAVTVTNGFNFIAAGDASTRFYAVQQNDYLRVLNLRSETPVDLTAQSVAIDNLIITPTEYKGQAQQLQAFYADKLGASSKVVDVQDIYNQFNSGMPDPAAIRQYVRYCFYNYPPPAISSVTLLGVGTNDWRNQTGEAASKNKMIVYQKVLPYAAEITSDDYFVMLSANNSSYPELAIGRYPVRTTEEMNFLLNRVVQYGSVPNPGWWRNTLLFFADDDVNGETIGEWIHSQYMESGSQTVNRSVLVDKIFGIDYDFDEFGNKPQARDDMIAKLNDGRLYWYYNGHGSYDKLGAEDYFNGFSDMGRLSNTEHLPLFLAASCDVAEFDSYTFNCLAEKLVLLNNGGAIASIASTRMCYAPENSALMNFVFDRAINQRKSIGQAVMLAKFSSGSVNNDATYVLLGDPLLLLSSPQKNNDVTINATNNQLQARQTAQLTGDLDDSGLNGTVEVRAYDSDLKYHMGDNSLYTKISNPLFKGNSSMSNGVYHAGFIVPDDISGGNTARVISYFYDASSGKDFVSYYAPLTLSGHNYIANNSDSPEVQLYLETEAFRTGDQVSTKPMFFADISDSTGINILGTAGHKIIMILDNMSQYTDLTDYFVYNTDSFHAGRLTYQLPELSEGVHTLQLIVFDNFNQPTVAETHFTAKKSSALTILKMLPYPNPMKKDGLFSVVLSEEGQLTLSIYTITGKKIRTIEQQGQKGYNQIDWDGKDADGDYLANNTYLYKVRVRNGSNSADKTGKFIIYH